MKRFSRHLKKVATGLSLLAFTSVASASGLGSYVGDVFYDFMVTVQGWATGPFGIGIALLMLLIGAIYGVSKNSPTSALSGVAAAALLHWGPTVIVNMMTGGAVI